MKDLQAPICIRQGRLRRSPALGMLGLVGALVVIVLAGLAGAGTAVAAIALDPAVAQPYWTTTRLAWVIGAVAFVLMLVSAAVVLRWRYRAMEATAEDLRLVIAEKGAAERALRESEERFRNIVETAEEGIWTIDAQGITTYVNHKLAEMLGYTEAEMLNCHLLDFCSESDRQVATDSLERRRLGVREQHLLKLRHKDGKELLTQMSSSPVMSGEGRYKGALAMVTDLTEHLRVEEALHAANEEWQRSFDALPDYVCILDMTGKIQRANLPMLKRFGPIYGNLIGLDYREIYCGSATPDPQPPCAAVLLGRPAVSVETELSTMDGWYKVSSYPLSDSQGQQCGAVSVVSDITERKRAETERDQLQKQLQQAQKMEAIGHLTGGIAHDFNNILASIMGYAELAMEMSGGGQAGKVRDYLKEVHHAGGRARDLIAQMLTFSRTSKGERHTLQLGPLVKEAVKLMRSTIPASIELHMDIDQQVPPVLGDPTMLYQVIMNLCINARDAMPGKGRIDIRLRHVRAASGICQSCHSAVSGDFLELAVGDTGNGIPPDVLNKIFDPFFTTKDTGKGTGMGLSMVHGIVHGHDGHIQVDSVPGQGTVFRVLLPSSKGVVTPSAMIEQEPGGTAKSAVEYRILVVDDEESIARFMGELLESHGYQPTIVSHSREALERFEATPNAFDLVITDQTMPFLTGAEMAQAMLALRPELPIILCTGHSEQVDEARAVEMGIRGYLAKPFTISVLLSKVRELLSQPMAVSGPDVAEQV